MWEMSTIYIQMLGACLAFFPAMHTAAEGININDASASEHLPSKYP